ncbi:MAG: hypothetical protein B6D41_03375 [Chloroflexi bacterium UTCFX4]|jgi:hypothetical protein|nr:MAG: hypothetical protein B6D41_03375 [Chloroflexi bacterium UTCFX4]
MTDGERALEILESESLAFVLVKKGNVIASGSRAGISELLETIKQSPDAARGASLADKFVGKAVAMLATHAGIVEIYASIGSETAVAVLEKHNIPFYPARRVPFIHNKYNSGMCPLERLILPLDDPAVAAQTLEIFIAQRRVSMPTL